MSPKITGEERIRKVLILAFLLVIAYFLIRLETTGTFSLARLREKQAALQVLWQTHPLILAGAYLLFGMIFTAMPLPIVGVYHLAAGALFGFGWGLALTLLGSTTGALISFYITRFFLHDFIQERWGHRLEKINQAVKKEGPHFLVTLRLVPGFPFFLTNLAMGLTPMRASVFFIASFFGSMPVTAAVVNAGTQLSEMQSVNDILSFEVLGSLVLIVVLSISLRFYMRRKHVPEVFAEDSTRIALGLGK